ncbi:MAG: ABC transporter permease [bacterium]
MSFINYFSIVRELAVADFRLKYQDSVLGYFWSMLNPLALFLVYHFVFSYLFVVQVPKFTLYLLSGIVFWNFFADATLGSLQSLENKASLTKKIFFPRSILIVSSTATAIFSLLINTVLLMIVVGIFDHISLSQLFTVVPLVLIILLGLAMAFILSILYIHFRDIAQIWNVLLTIGFWLTPVVYNALEAPAPLKDVALLNPIGRVLVILRAYLVFGDSPPISFIISTGVFCILFTLFGWWFFKKNDHKIAEYL